MKKTFLTLFAVIMSFFVNAQKRLYDKTGNALEFKEEKLEITFTDSKVSFNRNETGILAIIPTVIDMAFKIGTKIFEGRTKSYTAEYTKQQSYLAAGARNIPDFEFTRMVKLKTGASPEKAFAIKFTPYKIPDLEGFIYHVSAIDLNYSSARSNPRRLTFDYTIELKLNYLKDKEKKVIQLAPITISSVSYGSQTFSGMEHRTDIIPYDLNACLTEFSVKIVETNPAKVRAEKILAAWTENKDDVKTIINNFLPKAEEKKSGGDTSSGSDSTKTN